jgi:hypothetical protein
MTDQDIALEKGIGMFTEEYEQRLKDEIAKLRAALEETRAGREYWLKQEKRLRAVLVRIADGHHPEEAKAIARRALEAK